MVKLSAYVGFSFMSALGIVCYAIQTRQQFYLVIYYLLHSRISLAIWVNMALVLMYLCWHLTSIIFMGTLREEEVERLNEHFWKEVMEILFAMTVFRDELHLHFIFWISVLLFFKSYHWLVQKRVEYIETTTSLDSLSNVRFCTFMALLLMLDCLFFHRSFSHLLKTRQPSVSLFFAFEYALLITTTIATCIKYALHVGETMWERRIIGKDVFLFYVELVHDLLHFSLYLLFFLVIFIHYGLPLHLVRELYETFQNLKSRVSDFLQYRRLTYNMNERFQDPSPQELSRDPTCIICREEMIAAKKLPCGHLFHLHCLRSWLERQHTCPTCRAPLLGSDNESEQYDQDEDLDVDQDIDDHQYEVYNNIVEDQIANMAELAETTNESSRENGLQLTQSQDSALIPNRPYGQTFAYLAFTNGARIWYPVFLPMVSSCFDEEARLAEWVASIGKTKAHPTSESEYSVLGNTVEEHSPCIPNVSCFEPSGTRKWSYMPRILQIHEGPISISLNGIESPSASVDEGTIENELKNDKAACYPKASQATTMQMVMWTPGRLNNSCYKEQSAYLDRAIKVLQGQLQLAIDLQGELNTMHTKDHVHESSHPKDILSVDDVKNHGEPTCSYKDERSDFHSVYDDIYSEEKIPVRHVIDFPDVYSDVDSIEEIPTQHVKDFYGVNSDVDSKEKIPVPHVKDHCEHCPQRQSSQNSLKSRILDKH